MEATLEVLGDPATLRRALAQGLPEPVAVAAYEFMTGPLRDDPYRVGNKSPAVWWRSAIP